MSAANCSYRRSFNTFIETLSIVCTWCYDRGYKIAPSEFQYSYSRSGPWSKRFIARPHLFCGLINVNSFKHCVGFPANDKGRKFTVPLSVLNKSANASAVGISSSVAFPGRHACCRSLISRSLQICHGKHCLRLASYVTVHDAHVRRNCPTSRFNQWIIF